MPHLVGEHLLKKAGVARHAAGARLHLPRLREGGAPLRQGRRLRAPGHAGQALKASRPGALLLDGGDTWQGSATALWTNGAGHGRRLQAAGRGRDDRPLGVHLRHGAREGDRREGLQAGKVDFVAQNVKTTDFGDPVFKPYVIREINGVPVAIVGQAFPYTPIANPRYMVADWSFGIQDENMQKVVDEARAKGAQLVVVLSHNGMDVDLKMASRVRGIDAIFGGHTHDGVPVAVPVKPTPAAPRWSPTPAATASSWA
jgi:sulfur-oxidizing protein SoxB